jgi:hypothetical protein
VPGRVGPGCGAGTGYEGSGLPRRNVERDVRAANSHEDHHAVRMLDAITAFDLREKAILAQPVQLGFDA